MTRGCYSDSISEAIENATSPQASIVKFLIPIIQRAASACKQKLCVCVLGVVKLLLRFFGCRMG
jgi:hypothetical protein